MNFINLPMRRSLRLLGLSFEASWLCPYLLVDCKDRSCILIFTEPVRDRSGPDPVEVTVEMASGFDSRKEGGLSTVVGAGAGAGEDRFRGGWRSKFDGVMFHVDGDGEVVHLGTG